LKIAGISSTKAGDVNEGDLKNRHLYNEKELWEEGDLNWYDYGFRNYDPQIGRFPQLDPLTWEYPELTNYQYASCDPIMNIDLDGLEGFNSVQTLATVVIKTTRHAKTAITLAQVGNVALKALDIATDFVPLVSGAKDIYKGVRDGNWWQVGLGAVSIVADIFTLGGSSVAKGAVKTAVREGAEILAKEVAEQAIKEGAEIITKEVVEQVVKEGTEQVVKKAVTKGGTYVLKKGETVVRTGRTKNLAKRKLQHEGGKETKGLTFQAVDKVDDKAAQRGLEHVLSKKYESTASKANGGLNKIKTMSDKTLNSDKGKKYLQAAEDFLKGLNL
jgi:RHS repeat-associated protein